MPPNVTVDQITFIGMLMVTIVMSWLELLHLIQTNPYEIFIFTKIGAERAQKLSKGISQHFPKIVLINNFVVMMKINFSVFFCFFVGKDVEEIFWCLTLSDWVYRHLNLSKNWGRKFAWDLSTLFRCSKYLRYQIHANSNEKSSKIR